ncbi:MAG: ABC transporter substrate-binding protein, partial [Candidatus Nanopelagicales bacterium]|nr:ABC transporter substrate-binding protein [Candidatus Nanopelagicales bacterium]
MAALALAGCAGQADPTPSVTANRGDDGLTVGVLLSQTGYLKQFGVATTGGVMLAADDINGSGGVNGKPVALIVEDDGTDEQVAANKTEQLIAKNVSAIIGPNLSGTTLAVIDSIVKAGVIECSPSATSTQLTTYPDYGLFFRTAPPD